MKHFENIMSQFCYKYIRVFIDKVRSLVLPQLLQLDNSGLLLGKPFAKKTTVYQQVRHKGGPFAHKPWYTSKWDIRGTFAKKTMVYEQVGHKGDP